MQDFSEISEFPMGQVPVMKIGEEVFCQQRAIEDYAAKKAGLLGKTDVDQMKIEMIMETMNEIYLQGFIKAFMASTVEFPPSAEHPFMMAGRYTRFFSLLIAHSAHLPCHQANAARQMFFNVFFTFRQYSGEPREARKINPS